jgi:hypothetical protein
VVARDEAMVGRKREKMLPDFCFLMGCASMAEAMLMGIWCLAEGWMWTTEGSLGWMCTTGSLESQEYVEEMLAGEVEEELDEYEEADWLRVGGERDGVREEDVEAA